MKTVIRLIASPLVSSGPRLDFENEETIKDYSQVSCHLCLQPVSADSRKRKNFHGSSCDRVRQTLTRLSHCPLNALVQTSNPNAVICVVCHKKLVSVKACKDKLVALEGDVKNMLSSLTTIRSKRSLLLLPADTELQPPPPKQFRPAMHSLPFSQPPRVTLPTSHSSHQELSGAEHVSQAYTHTQIHTHTHTHSHSHTHTHTQTHTHTHTHTQTLTLTHAHTHSGGLKYSQSKLLKQHFPHT